MLTFEYSARDVNTGSKVNSTVQAQSESAAAKLLNQQGLAPLEIRLQGEKRSLLKLNKVKTKDKVIFFRQLSTLINAGLPLVQSLRTVVDQIDNQAFEKILQDIITNIEAGNTFSDSMLKYPKVFNDVMTSLVAAGETSGTLDEALERIAIQTEHDAEISSKVKGALVYPAIVLLVITGVIIFMLTSVLPQVETLYDDLGKELPFVTNALLFVANILMSFWWAIIVALVVGAFFLRRYFETDNGQRTLDTIKLSVPLFGPMFRKLYMARFARTGGTLLNSGVQMLPMLDITAKAVNNVIVGEEIRQAAETVKGGKALSDSLQGKPHFVDLVPQMIRIGEQSGSIDGMMNKAADFYEKELDNQIKAISTIIEPLLMVVLALVAGTMVAAILFPVYGLVGQNVAI